MKLYYKIWADALYVGKKNSKDWKWMLQVHFAMLMSLKFRLFMAILQRNILGFKFYEFKAKLFPNDIMNITFEYLLLYYLPFFVINYYLIFYENKHEQIVNEYKNYNGKLFALYYFLSLLPLVIFLLVGLFVINK